MIVEGYWRIQAATAAPGSSRLHDFAHIDDVDLALGAVEPSKQTCVPSRFHRGWRSQRTGPVNCGGERNALRSNRRWFSTFKSMRFCIRSMSGISVVEDPSAVGRVGAVAVAGDVGKTICGGLRINVEQIEVISARLRPCPGEDCLIVAPVKV